MDDNTSKLLEVLATKLGTTTEYIWGILIKQAHVSAITDAISLSITILCGIILYKLHKYFVKKDKDYNNLYERSDELLTILMCVLTIIWAIILVIQTLCIGDIVNGFANPEYWALDQILSKCK